MQASDAWMQLVTGVVCYVDRGVTKTMHDDLKKAEQLGLRVDYRRIGSRPVVVEAFHSRGLPHVPEECGFCRSAAEATAFHEQRKPRSEQGHEPKEE